MARPSFQELLGAQQAHQRLVCPGLDLSMSRVPVAVLQRSDASTPHRHPLYLFGCELADALAPFAGCFKINSAFFEAAGPDGMTALQLLVRHIKANHPDIPIIYDNKRGDIGTSFAPYAEAAFQVYGFDAMTVGSYLGQESMNRVFRDYPTRTFFALCVTSNDGSNEFQRLGVASRIGQLATEFMWERVATNLAREWNTHNNIGAVAGATRKGDLQRVRHILGPNMPILAPGIGTQGGNLAEAVSAGLPGPLVLNNSSAIVYASNGANFAAAAAEAAAQMDSDVRAALRSMQG
jgi:orotidine-5'-phosphate decarboxylase